MTERFECPEPSLVARDASASAHLANQPWPAVLTAAYTADLPALCRSEIQRFVDEWMEYYDAHGPHETADFVAPYLSSRFGVPEAAPERQMEHHPDCQFDTDHTGKCMKLCVPETGAPEPPKPVGEPGERCGPVSASTGAGGSFSIHEATPTAPVSKRIPYGQEKAKHRTSTGPCHDCRVELGQLHVEGCDWEECAHCGGQRIGCDCCKACRAAGGDYLVCTSCLDKLAPTTPPVTAPAEPDYAFTCPVCGGHWFGTVGVIGRGHYRHCNDQFGKGCRWEGSDAACMAPEHSVAGSPPEEPERITRECPKEHWCVLGYGHSFECRSVPVNRSAAASPPEMCDATGPMGHPGHGPNAAPLCTKPKGHAGSHQRMNGVPWPNTSCTACGCADCQAERDLTRWVAKEYERLSGLPPVELSEYWRNEIVLAAARKVVG